MELDDLKGLVIYQGEPVYPFLYMEKNDSFSHLHFETVSNKDAVAWLWDMLHSYTMRLFLHGPIAQNIFKDPRPFLSPSPQTGKFPSPYKRIDLLGVGPAYEIEQLEEFFCNDVFGIFESVESFTHEIPALEVKENYHLIHKTVIPPDSPREGYHDIYISLANDKQFADMFEKFIL